MRRNSHSELTERLLDEAPVSTNSSVALDSATTSTWILRFFLGCAGSGLRSGELTADLEIRRLPFRLYVRCMLYEIR